MDDTYIALIVWFIILLVFVGIPVLIAYRIKSWWGKSTQEDKERAANNEAKWSLIKLGMTKEEVKEVLGQPVKIKESRLWRSVISLGLTEVWSYGFAEGKVTFRYGKVVGYKKPS